MSDSQVSVVPPRSILESVPTEILTRILSFQPISHKAIDLWLCGSSALQRRLQRAVSIIELVNPRKIAFVKLPLVLTEFRALKSLTIDRTWRGTTKSLQFPRRTLQVLQSLSPALETLVLRFAQAPHLFFPKASARFADNADTSAIRALLGAPEHPLDLASLFPRLQSLSFSRHDELHFVDLQCLPDTLTELCASIKSFPDDLTKMELPPLRHLTLLSSEKPYALLPGLPLLEVLDVSSPIDKSAQILSLDIVKRMPASLRELKTNASWNPNIEELQALPPLLNQIKVCPETEEELNCILQWLETRPLVTELILYKSIKGDARPLPRSLTALDTSIILPLQQGVLPPLLTSLKVEWDTSKSDTEWVCFLPPTLRTCDLYSSGSVEGSHLDSLPRSIIDLTLSVNRVKGVWKAMPPFLRALSFSLTYGELAIPNMPDTVTSAWLNMTVTPETLLSLSPRIQTLVIFSLLKLELFDPRKAEYTSKVELLRNLAHREKLFDGSISAPLGVSNDAPQISLIDLLPQSLTSLEIFSGNLTKVDWRPLPRSITSLVLEASLDPNIMDDLPLESFTERLELASVLLTVAQAKRLRPDLTEFQIKGSHRQRIGKDVLPFLPYSTYPESEIWSTALLELAHRRRSALERAIQTSDQARFRELTSQ